MLPENGCVTQLRLATIAGMLNRDYEGQNCSIARALEVVGERWTLLIIREVLLGLHRFDEFQESLGIARNVLTDRLNRLGSTAGQKLPATSPDLRRADFA